MICKVLDQVAVLGRERTKLNLSFVQILRIDTATHLTALWSLPKKRESFGAAVCGAFLYLLLSKGHSEHKRGT